MKKILLMAVMTCLFSAAIKVSAQNTYLDTSSQKTYTKIDSLRADLVRLYADRETVKNSIGSDNIIGKQNYVDEGYLKKGDESFVYKMEFDVMLTSNRSGFMSHVLSALSKTYWGKDYKFANYYLWFKHYKENNYDSFKEHSGALESSNNDNVKKVIISARIYAMNKRHVIYTISVNDECLNIKKKESYVLNIHNNKQWNIKDIFKPETIESKNLKDVVKNGKMLFNGNSLLLAATDYNYSRRLNLLQESDCLVDEIKQLFVAKKNNEVLTRIDNDIYVKQAELNAMLDAEVVFDVVEQMPEFPGGPQALFTWLSQNIKYPAIAEENGVQGVVTVRYAVERDGSITDVKVMTSVNPALDKEAVRVVKSMPRWKPGKQNGKTVKVRSTVPVTFSLQENKKKEI